MGNRIGRKVRDEVALADLLHDSAMRYKLGRIHDYFDVDIEKVCLEFESAVQKYQYICYYNDTSIKYKSALTQIVFNYCEFLVTVHRTDISVEVSCKILKYYELIRCEYLDECSLIFIYLTHLLINGFIRVVEKVQIRSYLSDVGAEFCDAVSECATEYNLKKFNKNFIEYQKRLHRIFPPNIHLVALALKYKMYHAGIAAGHNPSFIDIDPD